MPEGVLTTAFDVDPGKAYYIADMVEREGFVAIRDYADPRSELSWELGSLKDNYDKTTADFHARFPKLSTLETRRALGRYRDLP